MNTRFKKGNIPWNTGKKGYKNSGSFKKGHKPYKYWLGKEISLELSKAVTESNKRRNGEKASSWKGDEVGYTGLHKWISKLYGSPKICDFCETETAKSYNWANKSGEYKRERNDWYRLCRKCHHAYDDISSKMWQTRRIYA